MYKISLFDYYGMFFLNETETWIVKTSLGLVDKLHYVIRIMKALEKMIIHMQELKKTEEFQELLCINKFFF